MKRTKNRNNKGNRYFLRINTYKTNYLKTIKKTLRKEPSQI